jgi:putative transcriptional regulator
MAIAYRLREVREDRRLTQRKLAELVGLSVPHLQDLERGRTKGVRFETLDRLCAALQCGPGDLLEVRDAGN